MFTAQRPFGGFGAATPAFGGTAFGTTTTPAFGASPTPAFGASATPAFGAPSATPAFGAATPAFGTTTPAFGATAPAFGASTPAFGATATPAFGGTSMTPFGASNPPFGGTTTTPAFGTNPTPSAFGTSTTPSTFGGFGSNPASTFGQPPGAPATVATSAFGTPASSSPTTAFGTGTTTSSFAFGAGGFGGASAPAASPFGATAPTPFSSSPFGAPSATTTAPTTTTGTGGMFGGGSATTGSTAFGGFGAHSPAAAAATAGTGNPKFQVTTEADPSGPINHQSITAMAAYKLKSFEELRWEDYQAGKKNSTSPAASAAAPPAFGTTPGAFGAAATSAPASSPFSFTGATTTPSTFGAPTTAATPFGGFGATTTAAPAATPFGSTPASSFSSFTPTLSTAPTTSTAAPASSPFGFTSASTSTSPFGTTTTPSPFGTTAAPAFSSFAAPTTAPTTTSAAAPFGSTAATTTNPFGGATTTTGSMFNPTAPANPFSSSSFALPSTSTAATPNLFNPTSTSTMPTPLFSAPSTSATTTPSPLFSGFTQSFNMPSAQIGVPQPTTSFSLGASPATATPATTTIASPPVGAPLPTFALPTISSSSTPITTPGPVAIPSLSFTPRTPTPQKHSYVSSLPRSLPARSGSLVRIKDSPSYTGGSGRLFSEDKGFSPSGIHITPENLSLRTATPSKPRVDIKKLNLPPFDEKLSQPKPPLDSTVEATLPAQQLLTPTRSQPFTIQSNTNTLTRTRLEPSAAEGPTLRNPHYYTRPGLDVLRAMGATELSRIEDFVVGCVDLGFVRWHGKTDIRGLNLDDIVIFEKKAVTVYPEQGIYPKPPVGEALNKPATITLLNVFPKKQGSADKYAQVIANATKKFDGKLLGYDPEKGIWEFEVRHFSRYGLSDDDDEPDARDGTADLPVSSMQSEQTDTVQAKITAPKAQLSTPDIPQHFSSQPASALQMSVYAPPDPTKSNRTARLSGLSTRGLLFTEEPSMMAPTHQPAVISTQYQQQRTSPLSLQQPANTTNTITTTTTTTTTTATATATAPAGHKGKVSMALPFSPAFIAKEHERTERAKSTVIPQIIRSVVPVQQSTIPIFTALPQAEKEASLIVHAPQLRLKKLALEESVVANPSRVSHPQNDVSLTMGRSFRVGWGPNGQLLRISRTTTLGMVSISHPVLPTLAASTSSSNSSSSSSAIADPARVPRSSPARIDRHLLELLQIHLAHSTAQYGPHFTLKDLHANIQANIKICDPTNDGSGMDSENEIYRQHLYLVWTLVYSLWGRMPDGAVPLEVSRQLPPDLDSENDATGRSISAHLTRKLLVSKWLTQALQGPVEDSVKAVKASSGNNALAILHYLTGRQVSPAVALAQRSRDFRLAVLLTQTWTSSLQLLGIQLEQWEANSALPFIDKQLLVVYKLLAGEVEHVGENIQEIRDDWLRCFALHFWYKHGPSTPMPEVIATYDAAVEQGSASAATPPYPYLGDTHGDRPPRAKDSLYRLLQLYAATTHQAAPKEAQSSTVTTQFAPPTSSLPTTILLSTVDPANQTQDPMDFSLAWHLYTILRIVPALSSIVDLPVPHRLHTSYAAQLEIAGHWQWAIYVLLHINFDSHKTVNGEWSFASGRQEAVSSVLERHAPSIDDEYYQFLTQALQVPATWVDAAVGRYLIYDRQYQAGIQRLLRAAEWNDAHRATIVHLVPVVLGTTSSADVASNTTESSLISLLEALQPNKTHLIDPTWNMGGHIYLAYFKLKHKLGNDESIQKNQNLQALQSEMSNIEALCALVAEWSQKHVQPATLTNHQQQQHTIIGMAHIATYIGHALLSLATVHRNPNLPHSIQHLPLPPDIRQSILEEYFHTIVYSV